MKKICLCALTLGAILATSAQAHITVWPRESTVGAMEKYTLRVPTEHEVATTGVELDAPEGVQIQFVAAAEHGKYTLKRAKGKIVGIVWTVNVPPGEFVELTFMARNPGAASKEIVWGLHQTFADGTTADLTRNAGGIISKSAVVTLKPAAKQ